MATKKQSDQIIKITSEDDAFRYLRAALADELDGTVFDVQFKNWPVLAIGFEGKGYDSTVTPQMAAALVELQHAMNRTYARVVRGSGNPNVLTNEQKRTIEFKAKVEKGSSLVTVDLGEYVAALVSGVAGKMDGTQMVATVLGLAVTAGSVIAYKSFLKNRSEDKKVALETQQRIALSQEETKRQGIFQQAVAAFPALGFAREDFDDARQSIIKSVSDAKLLKVQGVELSNAEAKSIASTPRATSQEVQLNGHYRIDKLDWTKAGEVRISLWSLDESLEFNARLNTDSLTDAIKEKLKASEWERQRVYMSINATRLRGEITTATIVGVDWPKAEK